MEPLPFIHRISTKIIITLTAVSILAVIATGSVLLTLSGRQLRANISERNLQIARRASNEISLYIEDSIRNVEAAADVLTAVDDVWTQDILLEVLAATFGRFDSLTQYAADGRLLASSRLLEEGIHFIDKRAVAVALGGEIFISPVGLTSEQLPYMTIAVRAGSSAEGPSILFAQLALRDIWELVDDISFGRQGEALLVSDEGILIAHPDKTRVMNEAERSTIPCAQQPRYAEGKVITYHPEEGAGMLLACAPVNSLGWSVVIQQPLAEAFLPLQSVLLRSGMLLITMLAVAVAASLILARLFSGPLNLVLAGTYRIGRGDLTHPINLSRNDEIGQLSAAFDQMVEQLRAWSSRLSESEERYRLMAESVQDVIFSLDKAGRLLYVNKRAEILSGYASAELRGSHCLDYLSPRNRRSIERRLDRSLSAELRRGLELELEVSPRRGALRILEVKLVQVFNSSGRLQFFGVTPQPDMMTINSGTFHFRIMSRKDPMGSQGRSYVYSNSPKLIADFAKGFNERGIGIEFECFDAGQVENVKLLKETGVLPEEYHLNFDFVMGIGGGMPATPKALMYLIDALPSKSHWCAMAISRHQAPITTMAMVLGGGVRVGFEDNVYLYKGVLADSNAQFVERAVNTAREIGREVATVEEAREILHLNPAK